jgi:hypothetical protein
MFPKCYFEQDIDAIYTRTSRALMVGVIVLIVGSILGILAVR